MIDMDDGEKQHGQNRRDKRETVKEKERKEAN